MVPQGNKTIKLGSTTLLRVSIADIAMRRYEFSYAKLAEADLFATNLQTSMSATYRRASGSNRSKIVR